MLLLPVLLLRSTTTRNGRRQMLDLVSDFFRDTIAQQPQPNGNTLGKAADETALSTPVFLSHGADDAWVSPDLGRQACRILQGFVVSVEWNEYTGAKGDGHWIKEPEGFDQILEVPWARGAVVCWMT